jgi:hypothetical protein
MVTIAESVGDIWTNDHGTEVQNDNTDFDLR